MATHPWSQRRIVVVGGGITGLSAAHRLRELASEGGVPVDVDLLESSPRLGGQIRTERAGDFLFEGGPDSLVAQKPSGVALCRRVGLGGELVRPDPARPRIEVVRRGRLVRLPAGFVMIAPARLWPTLASPLFSWGGKARILWEPFVPRRPAPPGGDESLGSFVTRRLGREVLERAAEPIAAGLYIADADRLSLRLSLRRFLELEERHGSVTRGLRAAARARTGGGDERGGFVSLRRGLGSLVDELGSRVGPGRARVRAPVTAVERDGEAGSWRVTIRGAESIRADAVILACPGYAAAGVLRALDRGLASGLEELPYASCATVSLVYPGGGVRLPPGTSGFFVPRVEGSPLLACSFMSAKFEERAPGDKVLLRAFVGGAARPGSLDAGDEDLATTVHRELRRWMAISAEPELSRVFRFPSSMPQYPVGHAARIDQTASRLDGHKGLFLAGTARGAVGLPDCIASGERTAERAFAFASSLDPMSERVRI